MATVTLQSSGLTTELLAIINSDDIQPGSSASYQACKTLYLFHPLGSKIAENPIRSAQSKGRKITVPAGPEERLVEAFEDEWEQLQLTKHLFELGVLARVYGAAALVYGIVDQPVDVALDPFQLWKSPIYFNVFDPLNVAGSLVLSQDPNNPAFNKTTTVEVQGKVYHRSRVVIKMNEQPVYISYTSSAFGYTGRSCYQRALYPLKSFIQSMITDDLVTKKAGVLVAKIKPPGSIIDNLMSKVAGVKRAMFKEAAAGNVLSIEPEEDVFSLDLTNIEGSMQAARRNILENIAAAVPMPAKLILQETFAEGFGEGTEDAKHVAEWIDTVREDLNPAYKFCDNIVMHRAWNPEFYAAIQREFPDQYGAVAYEDAFYTWKNSFKAEWPSLLAEPESERIEVDKARVDTLVQVYTTIGAGLDPENAARLAQWFADNLNAIKTFITTPLVLDWEALAESVNEAQQQEAEMEAEALKQQGEGGDRSGDDAEGE